MPRLWDVTIEAHRKGVQEAILDATAALVTEHGLRAVTMSQIAETAGIGRATLYKYYADVAAILRAWHEREIAAHFSLLERARDGGGSEAERLEAVLRSFATISQQSHGHRGGDLVAFLHHDERVTQAEQRLQDMMSELIATAAEAGAVRDDVPADELAGYCLRALGPAGELPSAAAVQRLVSVVLAGLGYRGGA